MHPTQGVALHKPHISAAAMVGAGGMAARPVAPCNPGRGTYTCCPSSRHLSTCTGQWAAPYTVSSLAPSPGSASQPGSPGVPASGCKGRAETEREGRGTQHRFRHALCSVNIDFTLSDTRRVALHSQFCAPYSVRVKATCFGARTININISIRNTFVPPYLSWGTPIQP